jgi:ATP-dependent DNA helicase PIF1
MQGGSTIHSYAGIGFGEDSKEYLAERIAKKAQHKKRWARTKVLVIDEISMLSGMKKRRNQNRKGREKNKTEK